MKKFFIVFFIFFFPSFSYSVTYTETFRHAYRTSAAASAASLTYPNFDHNQSLPAGFSFNGKIEPYPFYASYAPNGSNWFYGIYQYYSAACDAAQADLEQQCGSGNVFCDDSCSCSCTCSASKESKSSECGGIDKVQCDGSCSCSCVNNCSSAESLAQQYCGKENYQCDSDCNCPCTRCDTERDQAIAKCGDNNYTFDNVCHYTCDDKCLSAKSKAAQECGGVDKFVIDDDTCQYVCNGDGQCVDENLMASKSCGGPGTYTIHSDCSFYCNPDSQCSEKFEALSVKCGGVDNILNFNNATCTGYCSGCKDAFEQAKIQCDHPIATGDNCEFGCGCSSVMDTAEQNCPYGYRMDSNTCKYSCLTCAGHYDQCVSQCGGPDNTLFSCNDTDGHPDQKPTCTCKNGNNCTAVYAECDRKCSSQQCGGTAVNDCQEVGGQIVYKKCDCNGCTTPGEPGSESPPKMTCATFNSNCDSACAAAECGGVAVRECSEGLNGITGKCECNTCGNRYIGDGGSTGGGNAGTGNTAPNPSNPDDTNGWLKGIKGDLDDMTRQGEDASGWLKSIDSRLATANSIASQGFKAVADVGGGGSSSSVSGDVGTDAGNGTSSAGTFDVDSGLAWPSSPTDADLPSASAMDSAFGQYTPPEGGYRSVVQIALSSINPTVSDPSCGAVLHLPVPSLSGIVWHDYPLDFCPYGPLLNQIGSVFVFLTALYELYKLS